ncbi:4Fe-4S dicluster domain-containing protein [Bacillus sp. B15-48]|uniref:4Fe-4S dicluster domain-containing protein n=1 Tax=Bacillus sp. B15-48 TaxID=1548601 RepID=UPI00193ED2B3|nr:4Fe-4S dicluster domain-containing protein [Bacillus sp. B15-48]MBM4764677.1 hypothetical protein [Bacillus sp. B15-48]
MAVINVRNKCMFCGACARCCSFGAIGMDGWAIEINISKCTDCGDCIIACPVDAMIFTDEEEKTIHQLSKK